MMAFYFDQLVEIFPFFLKGLWMTSKIAFISLVSCTLFGLILGVFRTINSIILKRLVGVYDRALERTGGGIILRPRPLGAL